jgi:hypothetical protein
MNEIPFLYFLGKLYICRAILCHLIINETNVNGSYSCLFIKLNYKYLYLYINQINIFTCIFKCHVHFINYFVTPSYVNLNKGKMFN